MTVPATNVELCGARLQATYAFYGDPADADRRAEALRVEQTIEFPLDLVGDDDIRHGVVGQVVERRQVAPDEVHVTLSYPVEATAGELPQLLNVLWGNSSLLPRLRLVAVELPDVLLSFFRGPRFGVRGVRDLVGVSRRPLLATALKPMGRPAAELAEVAYQLARGGVDLVKDDHSLANQPFAPFAERVRRSAEAVARANDETGLACRYLPSVNAPTGEIGERVELAVDAGAGGLLVLPGIGGFDLMRQLADDDSIALPIMSHPALLGGFVAAPSSGVGHGVLFGTWMRLAGADMVVYPNYGGRFSFSEGECREIASACAAGLGALPSALPTPGGGMTRDRIGEIARFYDNEAVLLIGGDLHRGEDLYRTAVSFREAAESATHSPLGR